MDYKCDICNKKYSSYKSLWNHNKKFHSANVVIECIPFKKMLPKCEQKNDNNIKKELNINQCKTCYKLLSNRHSRWRHEQKCKEKSNDKSKDAEISKMKKEMDKLKDMLQKALKIHPKTLTKINKQLNNTNNGIINNIYVQLGNENLSDVLTNKQKMGILNRQVMGLNDLVELVHISGKYKKFMNVYITNLQNTIAYRYDEKEKNFIAVNKSELLDDLIDSRMYDIEKFYDDMENVLEKKKAENIKRFIDRMKDTDDYLKGLKKDEIKLVLYNNRHKIVPKEEDDIKEIEI